MHWKEYEHRIEEHFRKQYKSASITANAHRTGRLSGVQRQIDLLVEVHECDLPFTIVVDAKLRNRKLDVKDVEEFLGLVRDIGGHKGIMVTSEGYSNAALQRAHADDSDVILDVLTVNEFLEVYQGYVAIPYAGEHGVVMEAPLGWIIDGLRRPGALAFLYQQGLSFEEAVKACEFMYINFWKKREPVADLQALFAYQETYMKQGSNPVSHIEFIQGVNRDAKNTVRLARFQYHPNFAEYAGFVDFDGFIFMCVLFSKDEVAAKNLSKLRFVMRKVFPMNVTHEPASTGDGTTGGSAN